jgi:hypothetical protein
MAVPLKMAASRSVVDKSRRRYIGKSRAVRYDGTEKNAKALRYKKAKSADRIVYATKRNDE